MTRKMNTDGVVTVGNGRGFVEHRVYFDFGDGYSKLRRKVLNAFSEIDGSGPSKEAA